MVPTKRSPQKTQENIVDDAEYVKGRNIQTEEFDSYQAMEEVAQTEQLVGGEIFSQEGRQEIQDESSEMEPESAEQSESDEVAPDVSAEATSATEVKGVKGPRPGHNNRPHGGGRPQHQQNRQGQNNRPGPSWQNNRSKKTKTYQVTLEERFSDNPIDWVIAECCGERWNIDISRKRIKQLLASGAIKVNGRIERFPNKQVQVGDRLEICLPIEEIRQSNDNERPLPTIEFTEANIIYQDDAIVVLNKPAGIPSQGTTDPTRDHAYEALRRYLEEKEGREVYLAIHHRLDSDTSGPLLFCRKKSFNKPVQELFSERTAVKTYLAIVCLQKPLNKTEWRVENQLARSKKHPMKMESVASGGDQAVTSFRVLKQKDKYALIQAQPHTGRMHQIRVHLAEEGLPIVGDYIYAGKELGDQAKRTMLHSWKLEFTHPEDQRPICAEAPVPDDFQAMLVKMGLN